MMNGKNILTALAAGLVSLSAMTASAQTDDKGRSILDDVRNQVPGYEHRMNSYLKSDPLSVHVPQISFAYARNLFDQGEYAEAFDWLSRINQKELPAGQRDECMFKMAYCAFEKPDYADALQRFLEVEARELSDYTAPSRYAIGYIKYCGKDFDEALKWFGKASDDPRFSEMAGYYIMECRFMLKDYAYVTANADSMYRSLPEERKPHFARMISEAWLVLGEAENARKYYELGTGDGKEPDSRTDWFHSGSVLYAVDDYAGAIRSFTNMTDRTDSIGQVANYHLAHCYIQTKNKVAALDAFRDAAMADFDPRIKEDAYYNWAKLAFDLNTDTSVFNDYIRNYPAKEQEDRINSYIAVAALYDRDYEGAVEAYDKIDELDDHMTLNYMKANYLRAEQLISNGSYRKAVPCLKAAAYYSERSSRFNQLSRYWLAESYYRNDQYDDAISVYTDLYNTSALYGRPESYLLQYNIAYCHFKKEDYASARKWFDSYLAEPQTEFRKDALVRRADCFFISKDYKEACAAYDLVLDSYFNADDIYPYYQAALSYGLVKKVGRKIELLSNVMNASPSAEFYPEAMFELGRAYVSKEEDEKAFECFNRLASEVKDSVYVARAYIEMGSLARNQSQYNEALGYYKTVVEEMPMSGFAEDALAAIESIYQTRNQLEEYIAYIDSIGKGGSKSEDEKELMIFNSAEQIFLSENYQKALVALQSYLDKYPDGAGAYKAHFYMAESYRMLDKLEQACDSYRNVIEKGEGSFVELSMLNFSNLSYRMEKWEDAFGGYSSLYSAALLENNKYAAVLGMMRSAYKGRNHKEAVRNADKVMADSLCGASERSEAMYVKAKSYLATSSRPEAYAIFAELAADVKHAYGAEAAYLIILDSYDKGEFEDVETKVYAFADAGSGQMYWLAKSFIVLGDSFVERDDLEQAKATFESVRDGYVPTGTDDDVLDNVNMRLKKLEELMAE
jgi:tetratricopeptide (TPR) repeat protein